VPGRPTCPVISASAIRQRALSVPCTCWLMPMPQKMMEARERAYNRATSRKVSAGMPQIGAIFSGVNSLMRSFSSSKPSV